MGSAWWLPRMMYQAAGNGETGLEQQEVTCEREAGRAGAAR
jgi:hypothetical protein